MLQKLDNLSFLDLPKQLFSYKFTTNDVGCSFENANTTDTNEFVSAVCWRRSNDVLMAGNRYIHVDEVNNGFLNNFS